jgi:predicted RNA-binding protein with PIN domain
MLTGRSLLCRVLGMWAKRQAARVHVVFDGPAPPPGLAEQIAGTDLTVSYSGLQSADDVIRTRIAEDTAPRRLAVVSSDREIIRAARRRRARAIESEEFWEKIRAGPARRDDGPGEPEAKQSGLDAPQTSDWLREFGF